MKLIHTMKLILGGLLIAGIAACGGGGGGTASDTGLGGGAGSGGVVASGMGTMKLSLTDAPACGYDEVNVTIEKVRVHQGATAGEDDGGWSELVLPTPRRINLLDYTNGALLDLGGLTLPPGQYSQLRLVLAANDASAPLENSVKPTGGAETELSTPSAQQSGLKLKVNIDVPADKVAHVVLDFDACKSVVKRGNSGKYNLKPVLSAITVLGDGQRVVGYVDTGIALPRTNVSVQFNGVPFKATAPDANGLFILYPVPVGTYDLVVTSALHATAVMTGVPVTTTEDTVVSTAAVPIKPTGGDPGRVVKGTVTQIKDKDVGATVRAMQTFTDGTRVEVAWQAIDALPGEFEFLLPIKAPEKTAYLSATPLSLGFTADSDAKGKYTLQAVSSGLVQTGVQDPIDVNTGNPADPVVVNFLFP